MADDISKKLGELRAEATKRLEEARSIVAGMNTVETLFDLPLTKLADLETAALAGWPLAFEAPAEPSAGQVTQQRRSSSSSIRRDEYFGDEPMEAAKKYMRSVGHAVSFDEITTAVEKGGAAIQGADWRDRLEISLKRSPYQVITVADKTYGLAEFYTDEQLKRFRDSRRTESGRDGNKKKKTAKSKGKVKGKVTAKASADDAAREPGPAPKPPKKKPDAPAVSVEATSTPKPVHEPVH